MGDSDQAAAFGSTLVSAPIAIPEERADRIRREHRFTFQDAWLGMLRSILIHPNAEGAEAYRLRLLEAEPKLDETIRGRGVALANEGRLQLAVKHLRLAAHLRPELATAWHDLGVGLRRWAKALLEEGDPVAAGRAQEEAQACLRRSAEMDPSAANQAEKTFNALVRMGRDRLHRGSANAAAGLLREALAMHDEAPAAWLLLTVALLQLGATRRAAESARSLAHLQPQDAFLQFTAGVLGFRTGAEWGVDYLDRAVAMSPSEFEFSAVREQALSGAHRSIAGSLKRRLGLERVGPSDQRLIQMLLAKDDRMCEESISEPPEMHAEGEAE
jgi:tetratricopeptide (TPR) repeat protein